MGKRDSAETLRAYARNYYHTRGKAAKQEYYQRKKADILEYRREHRSKNRDKINACLKSDWYKRNYGITLEQRDQVFLASDNKCCICGCGHEDSARGTLVMDHCHSDGHIRGALCHRCNTGLGQFRDSTALLVAAARYLEMTRISGGPLSEGKAA